MASSDKRVDAHDKSMKRSSKEPSTLVKYYLVAYNTLSALGWSYLLIVLFAHLTNMDFTSPAPQHPPSPSALTQFFTSITKQVPFHLPDITSTITPSPTAPNRFSRQVAGFVLGHVSPELAGRLKTAYEETFDVLAVVQTFALLEVVHVLLGLVRSPIGTTLIQVGSRIWLVWGIVARWENTHTNPLYTSMLLAWCLTEVPRYTFYSLSLLSPPSPSPSSPSPPPSLVPFPLTWLRYTAFYILYPLGAGSEAFLMLATVPEWGSTGWLTALPGWKKFGLGDWVRAALFVAWWPGLYIMYTHMMAQRRKVIGAGKGQKLGNTPKVKFQ